MARIDAAQTKLTVQSDGTVPKVAPSPSGTTEGFSFTSPRITAAGSIRLTGTAGESVAGWMLGFVQLKYIGTNYARYRGIRDSDGSLRITGSNQIVCRDTDVGSSDVWYGSVATSERADDGTNVLAAGAVLPASGFLDVTTSLLDYPSRWWSSVETNELAPGRPTNFLRHVDIGLAFCTMLVAREPTGHYHLLRHFYWNVRWEQRFVRNALGAVVIGAVVHMQMNIQRQVHSGSAHDRRFHKKEFDLSLPISLDVSNRPMRVHSATDWSLS